MIKTDIIINITNDMALVLTQYQLEKLKETLENNLKKVEINILTDEKEKQQIKETNDNYINIFLSAKEVEGCSTRTLKYYREIIEKLINTIDKPIKEIQTEEIRKYLADDKENIFQDPGRESSGTGRKGLSRCLCLMADILP